MPIDLRHKLASVLVWLKQTCCHGGNCAGIETPLVMVSSREGRKPDRASGEAAHEHLLDRFNAASFSEVSKEQASALIDELQASPPRTRPNGGAVLQR